MRRFMLPVALTLAGAGAARAQVVQGRVVDAATDRPVAAAEVALLDAAGEQRLTALTDTSGAFRLPAPRPGRYALRVAHLAYDTVAGETFEVAAGELVEVVVRVGARPIELAALEVTARRGYRTGPLAEFYERLDRRGKGGWGHFVTRDEIERRPGALPTDLLRMIPRVEIVRSGIFSNRVVMRGGARGYCAPLIYVDGMFLRDASPDELLSTADIEGIEVYRGAAEMPAELYDVSGCGVVAFWTRRDVEGGRPFTWRRLLVLLGAAAGAFLLSR